MSADNGTSITQANGRRIPIAAERRRQVHNWVLENDFVDVASLAEEFGVGATTIRRDLDALHEEGKLIRSHGGAVAKETSLTCPSYLQTRDAQRQEKSWIGAAAAGFIPASGAIFINAGTTTYQLALSMPANPHLTVVTDSLDVAGHLAPRLGGSVQILGGTVRPEFNGSDLTLSNDLFSRMHWDACFVGVEAIDLDLGIITTAYPQWAAIFPGLVERSRVTVVLADSSKFGRVSHVEQCSVDMIDVLVTDCHVNPGIVSALTERGVEVVVAGSPDNGCGPGSNGGNGRKT